MTEHNPESTVATSLRNDDLDAVVARLVSRFQRQKPMRAGSLLVTVFGDAIAPHGGTVWLGSLIAALQPFGVNQRLVRTSVFRLARDGWLSSEQIGRRSYYSLNEVGRQRFVDASRHIYSEPRRQWSGTWSLILLAGVPVTSRDVMRKELSWLGYAPFSTDLMAHPSPDIAAVEQHLQALPDNERLVISVARITDGRDKHFNELISRAWALTELEKRYSIFLDQFRPVYRTARKTLEINAELAFRTRTLLIHEYRKIVLRDPLLPEPLLPEGWNGVAAYQLCRNLYQLMADPSERFLMQKMETADGPLPPADPGFDQRFGNLDAMRKSR